MRRRGLICSSILVTTLACSWGGDEHGSSSEPPGETSSGTTGTGDSSTDGGTSSGGATDFPSCPTALDPAYAALGATIDAERVSLGATAMSVALIRGHEIVYCAGFGTVAPEGGAAVDGQTMYRIGSVTKMMTATGLLQQVDNGAVDLDRPLAEQHADLTLDQSPTSAMVTARQLLSHQGGYYDHLVIDAGPGDDRLEAYLLGEFKQTTGFLLVEPGTFWNYSNPNFYVAGLVAERAAARPYRDILREDVFAPLGMTRTMFLPEAVEAAGNWANSRSRDWTGATSDVLPVTPSSYTNAWARPAGYAWGSAEDLARFGLFLMQGNDTVLTAALHGEMVSPQVDTKMYKDRIQYGFGTIVQDGIAIGTSFYETRLVAHDGAIPGYSAAIYTIPDSGFGLIALAAGDGAYLQQSLATALLDFANLPAPTAAPETDDDPARYIDFVGTYAEPWGITGDFTVVDDGGTLTISFPLLDEAGIAYESRLGDLGDDNFIVSIVGIDLMLSFMRDEVGTVTLARHRLFVGAKGAGQRRLGGISGVPRIVERLRSADLRVPIGLRLGAPG